MKALNKQALREAAENALQGKWEWEAGAIWNTNESGWVQHMATVDAGDEVSDEEHKNNMLFITAATPSVVLAMLDEQSELETRVVNESDCADNTINLAINWQMRCKDAEAKLEAAQKYAKDRDAENEDLMLTVGRLRMEKEVAEKQNADYRARLDRLERRCDHQGSVYWDVSGVKRCARCGIAAGIGVKGE